MPAGRSTSAVAQSRPGGPGSWEAAPDGTPEVVALAPQPAAESASAAIASAARQGATGGGRRGRAAAARGHETASAGIAREPPGHGRARIIPPSIGTIAPVT